MRHRILALANNEVIAYSAVMARAFNCSATALFLSQAVYWQAKAGEGKFWYKLRDAKRDNDGKILSPSDRTKQSWEWETGLTRSQQERARKRLITLKILEEKKQGIPQRNHFRVNTANLEKFLLELPDCYFSKGRILPTEDIESALSKGLNTPPHGEIPPYSTKRSTRNTENSRKQEYAFSPPPRVESVAEGATNFSRLKVKLQNIGGIECWHEEDINRAKRLLEHFGQNMVHQAVATLNAKMRQPLPLKVEKELHKMEQASSEKREAEQKPDVSDGKKVTASEQQFQSEKFKQMIQSLPPEEFLTMKLCYLSSKEGAKHSKSYDASTGNFKNGLEGFLFKSWLSQQMILRKKSMSMANPSQPGGNS